VPGQKLSATVSASSSPDLRLIWTGLVGHGGGGG
jgi:hypothetical protein